MSQKVRHPIARRNRAPWIVAGVAALALVVVLASGRSRRGHVHPEPRPDAASLGLTILPSFFANSQDVQQVYQIAQQIPATLDGIYCYCYCLENMGHRSLFQCFQSQHAAGCDVCLAQAVLAYQMQREGRTLAEIRTAMDLKYQT